jgi:signal transduction histidine kinase
MNQFYLNQTSQVRALFITFLLSIIFTFTGISQDKNKNILILHSYHQGFTWTDSINNALIESLKRDSSKFNYEIYIEYLDTKRIPIDILNTNLTQNLSVKFKNTSFSVVITSDDNAFQFAIKNRNLIFSDAPIVFCGVNNFDKDKNIFLLKEKNYTGVVEGFDMQGAIKIALKLSPKASTLLIINDSTTTGLANQQAFNKIKNNLPATIEYTFSTVFEMDSVASVLNKYSKQTAILLLSFNKDKTGNYFDYQDAGRLISTATELPVYVLWDFYMGTGVVGGLVVSGTSQGQAAAALALQILKGKPADSLPVILKSPNQYIFDFKELEVNGIYESDLPKSSILINKPISFLSKYKFEIIGLGTLFTILTVTIIVLIFINRKKTKAEFNLKQKEVELIEAKNKAEQSDKLKSAFLANMSHEIRTPMNAILGFSSLLNEEDLGSDQREMYIELIQSSGNNLLNLINDILDLSRIEAGQIEISKKPFDVNILLNELYITYSIALESYHKSGIHFAYSGLEESLIINSDYFRLNQVFSNLLNNAIKFTNEGNIEFGCYFVEIRLIFYVSDTGMGIDEEFQIKICERFQKVDTFKNQVFRGIGLGLSISKSIVDLLGGVIWFEPNSPCGTKFLFTIEEK